MIEAGELRLLTPAGAFSSVPPRLIPRMKRSFINASLRLCLRHPGECGKYKSSLRFATEEKLGCRIRSYFSVLDDADERVAIAMFDEPGECSRTICGLSRSRCRRCRRLNPSWLSCPISTHDDRMCISHVIHIRDLRAAKFRVCPFFTEHVSKVAAPAIFLGFSHAPR